MLNGKIHYFDWAIFNSKLFVYQRVSPRTSEILVGDHVAKIIINHPPVITIFIGGMFTIPKWVVYYYCFTMFYPHYKIS